MSEQKAPTLQHESEFVITCLHAHGGQAPEVLLVEDGHTSFAVCYACASGIESGEARPEAFTPFCRHCAEGRGIPVRRAVDGFWKWQPGGDWVLQAKAEAA